MIPHKSIVKHDPPNSYGDCLRGALASLLNYDRVEQVPHFMRDGDDERGQAELKEWLLTNHRVRPFYLCMRGELNDVFEMMKGLNTDIEYLLFCNCGGDDHVVICRNDRIIHDPAWYVVPPSGPTKAEGVWVVVVLVPVKYG